MAAIGPRFPALPRCFSRDETVENVTANLREAIEGGLLVETTEANLTQRDRVIELAV